MTDFFKVGCDYLCVPDGRDSDGNLRLSVQVSPVLMRETADKGPTGENFIPIELWPERIAKFSEEVLVQFATDDNNPVPGEWSDPPLVSHFNSVMMAEHSKFPGVSRAQMANDLWRKAFRYEQPVNLAYDFHCLHAALVEANRDTEAAVPEVARLLRRRSSDIAMFFDALAGADGRAREANASVLADLWQQSLEDKESFARPELELNERTSAQQVEAAFARRSSELEELTNGIAAALEGRSADAASVVQLMQEMRAILRGPDDGMPIDEDDTENDWGADPAEAGKRKLSAILSIPSLAHYLGCGLQITVPAAQVPAQGLVRVRLKDDPNEQSQWTAYSLDTAGHAPNRGFMARMRPGNSKPEEARFLGEHVHLAAMAGDSRRFRLSLFSPTVSASSTIAALTLDPQDERAASGQEAHTRGIGCFDSLATEEKFAEGFQDRSSGFAPVSYMEDLFRGYRPDIGVALADGTAPASRWRSLTQRRVVCRDAEMDPDFYGLEPVKEYLLPRDHGLSFSPDEEHSARLEKGVRYTATSTEDDMFVWSGESLAVTRSVNPDSKVTLPDDHTQMEVSVLRDLGLEIDQSCDGGLPPLRDGLGYYVGARLCFANGAGPAFDAQAYSDPRLVLGRHGEGDTADTPLFYNPIERQAPDVHLAWDEPVITARTRRKQKGESGNVAVIRDDSGETRRFVTPPRVPFDVAETQGQFDGSYQHRPSGAFARRRNGHPALWLSHAGGSLPEARFHSIRYTEGTVSKPQSGSGADIDLAAVPDDKKQTSQALGTVAVLVDANNTLQPYYVNRHDDVLNLRLRDEVTGNEETASIAFWDKAGGETQDDAAPVLIELEPGNAMAISVAANGKLINDSDGGLPVNVPCVTITLPETVRATLSMWCRDEEMQRTIDLVHARIKPKTLAASGEVQVGKQGFELGLNPVTVTAKEGESWVTAANSSDPDELKWTGSEGGATTYFTGRVKVDRREVSQLTAEAVWKEFNTDTIQQVTDKHGVTSWQELPQTQSAKLFEIEVSDTPPDNDEANWVSLLKQDPKEVPSVNPDRELRNLSYNFADGRARMLEVTMKATSAFTEFYDTDLDDPDERKKHEKHVTLNVATECTFRPPPPVIKRALPLFNWTWLDRKHHQLQRTAGLRIYPGTDWFASGVNEQLGIVLLPGGSDIANPCDYYSDDLAPFQRFLSRPGKDPSRSTSGLPLKLDASNFPGASNTTGKLLLAEDDSTAGSETGLTMDVELATFPITGYDEAGPYFDIDIRLDEGMAYHPFLHLGLVRYQEHALDGLKLSHPIEYIAHVLPSRKLEISNISGRKWKAEVAGPTYNMDRVSGTAPLEPRLAAKLFAWREARDWRETSHWVQIEDNLALEPASGEDLGAQSWVCDRIRLPARNQSPHYKHFMIHVEEFERIEREDDPDNVMERLTYSAGLKI